MTMVQSQTIIITQPNSAVQVDVIGNTLLIMYRCTESKGANK